MYNKILSWNVRGLGATEKRVLVKRTLKKAKAEIIILQETKLEIVTSRDIHEFTGSNAWGWTYLPSIGTRGGIIILWDVGKISVSNQVLGSFTLTVDCLNLVDNFNWRLSGIYDPSRRTERNAFWVELFNIGAASSLPWCLGGDFNTIRVSDDKWGGSRLTSSMRKFNNFIDVHELVELPLQGALYTWSDGRSRPMMTKIYRFLLSQSWASHYPLVSQKIVTKFTSDHKAIALDIGGQSWGPSPFRFEAMWLLSDGFDELVETWWASYIFTGTSCQILCSKLKALRSDLKKWSKEIFGQVERNMESLQQKLDILNQLEETSPLSPIDLVARENFNEVLRKLIILEEVKWKQRSRISFLACGDQNSAYFHGYANARRRNNAVLALNNNGDVISDMESIKKEVVDFYINLYQEEVFDRPQLDSLVFPQISHSAQAALENPCLEDEVLAAISDLGQDKAPGPDGFPILFFKHFWYVIKIDFLSVIADFFYHSQLDWRLNTTFIFLLPKKNQIETVSDFRPIALLSRAYKIIAKILSSRLKLVMPSLVSYFQSAYIKGRQITDGILIANELVDSRLKASLPGIICKVDMEKAFDRVSWQYIDFVLLRMGFGTRWRHWIHLCLSTSSFSILINGTACGFFRSSRGVRQGDPISPLIFDLAMEGLSLMLQRATDLNRISGFKAGLNGVAVSHLHYADDTIIFLDGVWMQIDYTLSILKCFEIVSGLRINISKTMLIEVGIVPDLAFWASQFGCSYGSLPSKYLGLPLGANPRTLSTWDPVIANFDKRLGLWQSRLLSKGGKLTLIKSTLTNLPIYFLSVMLAPIKIINTLERKIKKFLWAHNELDKGYHLVNWQQVCSPKEVGGLGIRQLRWMNKAFLAKWCWRYGVESSSLWRIIVVDKFSSSNSIWHPKITRITQGVGCWQRILKSLDLFSKHQEFTVHSGIDVRFWLDSWLEAG